MPPEVAASAAETPEEAAPTAEPPEVAASTAESPEVVAPTFELTVCHVTATEAVHELTVCHVIGLSCHWFPCSLCHVLIGCPSHVFCSLIGLFLSLVLLSSTKIMTKYHRQRTFIT